jgi:hypothetical protein
MIGNRPSLLPIVQFCGGAAQLAAVHGAGRSAAMSSAAHANFAGQPDAKRMLAMLSDVERETVLTWQPPTTVHYCPGVELDYASAEKELPVGLDEYGYHCDAKDEGCICSGTLDFAWVRTLPQGEKVAFVGDIKRTPWAASEGAESLQLHAYAHAFASKHNCQAYCTGIWLAEEGEWLWSKDMVVMGSERQVNLWERLFHAIQNTSGEYNSGAHCSGCYERLHCPEFSLPAMTAESWLAPLNDLDAVRGDLDSMRPAELGALVLKLQAFEKVADKVKEEIQERVRRGALSVEADGKRWVPVKMPGRKGVDMTALKEALGPKMDAFAKVGAPYDSFKWCKR